MEPRICVKGVGLTQRRCLVNDIMCSGFSFYQTIEKLILEEEW
jgi:hypothetical protein